MAWKKVLLEGDAGGGSPGGATGDVQYNDGASGFAGEAAFNYDAANNKLKIDNLADTGGTTRVTLATASPHVTLTGDTYITGIVGISSTPVAGTYLTCTPTSGGASSIEGFRMSPNYTFTANSLGMYGLIGSAIGKGANGRVISYLIGLQFGPACWAASGSITVTNMTGMQIGVSSVLGNNTITTAIGIDILSPNVLSSGTPVWGTIYGMRIKNASGGQTTITTVYGLYIEDTTTGTNQYIAHFGGATPQVRIDGGGYAVAAKTALVLNVNGTLYRVIRNAADGVLKTEAA